MSTVAGSCLSSPTKTKASQPKLIGTNGAGSAHVAASSRTSIGNGPKPRDTYGYPLGALIFTNLTDQPVCN